MPDYPIAHCINAGQNGYFARDWYTRQEISVGHDLGDCDKQTDGEIHEQDPTQHNYVSRFLGCHPNDALNLHVGDNIITYAPVHQILLGVGSILSDPRYEPDPITLTNEDDHYYWHEITWLPWSRPVDMDDLKEVDQRFAQESDDRAFGTMTMQRYNGDFTGLKQAIEECDPVDLNEQ